MTPPPRESKILQKAEEKLRNEARVDVKSLYGSAEEIRTVSDQLKGKKPKSRLGTIIEASEDKPRVA